MAQPRLAWQFAHRLTAALPLWLACAGWAPSAGAELPDRYELADLKALEQAFVALAEDIRPSVVAIQTYRLRDPGRAQGRLIRIPNLFSRGSGFVIDSHGFIATNRHVLEEADIIEIRLHNGRAYEATVQQADMRTDLAVLKIDAQDLKPVRWGDLSKVRVNQWSFAVGNPFGLARGDGRSSVTYGVVSALGRQLTPRLARQSPIQYYGNLIETSSAINPGNSGGPLFNIDGEVIGIVTAIETSSGVNEGHGYAIPIDKNTRHILDTLKAGKRVHYGFLGVTVGDVAEPVSDLVVNAHSHRGAAIAVITHNEGPAAQAGLKPNDIIIEFDGTPVEDSDHLVRLVGFTPPGAEAAVTYLRDKVKRKTTVMLSDMYEMLNIVRSGE